MSEMNEYADDFFADMRPKKYEKINLNKVVSAMIKDVSKIRSNPADDEKEFKDKNDKVYKKLFFTVTFALDEPINDQTELFESYGFRIYPETKTAWYGGKESSCGKLIEVLIKNIPELSETPSPPEIRAALLGRKVKIVSESFGPSKSQKIMIASFI